MSGYSYAKKEEEYSSVRDDQEFLVTYNKMYEIIDEEEGENISTRPAGRDFNRLPSSSSEDPADHRQLHRLSSASSSPVVNVDQFQKFASIGVGVSTLLLESLLSHPCVVLRRQCQVNKKALSYHLTPFTLIPVAAKLVGRQGLGTLWKGASSVFIVHGITLTLETAVSDLLGFPKEIYSYSPLKHILEHLTMKSISLFFVSPFLCSSLVETVQSDVASEKPAVLDCLKEGLFRIVQFGKPRTSRMLPIWILVAPAVLHGLLSYSISAIIHSTSVWYYRKRFQVNSVKNQDMASQFRVNSEENEDFRRDQMAPLNCSQADRLLMEASSSLLGSFLSDSLLYPMETVLHRLYLQGTRAIIDDLDSGLAVTPVVSRYEGPFDCFQSVANEEGASGLYRGFGALIIQYALQALILKGTCSLLNNIRHLFGQDQRNALTPSSEGNK